MRPQTVAGARRHRLRRAGASRHQRAAATGSDWLGLGRAARAGADWLGRPADPKLSTATRLRAASARSLRPSGDGVKLGPLLLQWRPVATKRSLMLACSVVVQSSLRSSRKAMLQLSLMDHPGHHRRVTSPPIRCDY